ncbi:NADH-ubiquinone/plastoquinone (complex i), various chains domain protein [Afipia carboxidovorans OM5]|uniref:K+/H+ antiporter subunit D, putative PhaD n=1 Tax=Afipia carboxidovorans (strain ATCC 49405 / DSM 1227 / KCTC 32145 / OM5) TaxID=504832 RepID=B6JCB4_AFIC5|nr:monovalent cation/H+ antiporter subunit D [Afipia carboxidovorans]ACI92330.1 NADH-ubiquinone/plastoquinone (complex i), various chains domain protein [Afipia carboxidovorans OM5]AEI03887.1 K+/H+ antiporter subunit D, putative PhaD [Afipia carboxidovorans OM4]AEI07464.1 K+/H+ antiporter subunit D, putative PhaD [Afipia carboxidovorans OM5]
MNSIAHHLMIAPIALPLVAGAIMLALGGDRRTLNASLNVITTIALVAIAITLLCAADASPLGISGVYRLGNWPAPFAIVLVFDRLSAAMLLLTSILALATLVFALARWHRVGVHFHPLFQLLLMGLNGAFLTGDLFNLFVFFEVLLAASYGLALHGSGSTRVTAGMHYIIVNLVASLLFLVGVSLIYSVTGTLNMADLAARIPTIRAEDRALLEAGAGVLGIAFLTKAGMWPMCFWLPGTYAAAPAPVASLFAILTKVGVYIVLRLSLLLFGDHAGESAHFGGELLLVGGMATIAFGTIGTLASQEMARLASYSVLISSGTILAAVGMGQIGVTSGALYYLVSSTLGLAAFFLLIELAERGREPGADVLAVTRELYGEETELEDAEETQEVGIAIPASMALIGGTFICCALVISGLPPLSGFIGKFALLTAALNSQAGAVPVAGWAFLGILIVSGFATLIATTRAGINTFWASPDATAPRVRLIEIAPVVVLILLCAALTIQAGPTMRFMQVTAESLHMPHDYVNNVLGRTSTPSELRRAER